MRQILPNKDAISSLNKRTTFFYFFKLKDTDENGTAIREQFVQHQAKCLLWLECEYAFVGESKNTWTHAAVFKFPNFDTVTNAIDKGINSNSIEAIQGFAVRPTHPPKFILFLFKLLRPIGAILKGNTEGQSVSQIIEIMGGEGGIISTKAQVARHLQNKRTSKAYMINLLQTYKKAQYPNENSKVSGATAYYKRYGSVAARSVYMLGGQLVFAGRMGQPIIELNAPKLTKGSWEGIGIMEYPNPANLMALEKMPGYKKSLIHRDAGLEKTALIISKNGFS